MICHDSRDTNYSLRVTAVLQVEEMYRGEFDLGPEKKLSLNIEDTRLGAGLMDSLV